jgi:hypothetical protein
MEFARLSCLLVDQIIVKSAISDPLAHHMYSLLLLSHLSPKFVICEIIHLCSYCSCDSIYLYSSIFQVSNHVAAMDDPFVIASLLPPSVMLQAQKLRWTLCATDRCFTNPILSTFFRSVKVLPVSRGDGIYQKVPICDYV